MNLWINDAHLYSTLCMVGLIWFVQVVHYPMMADVDQASFVNYERIHRSRTTMVVMPLMLTELATAILLLLYSSSGNSRWLAIAGLVLVVVIWLTTFLLSVPMHERLSQGFDAEAHRRLVNTNWIRTWGWSLRGVIAILLSRSVGS